VPTTAALNGAARENYLGNVPDLAPCTQLYPQKISSEFTSATQDSERTTSSGSHLNHAWFGAPCATPIGTHVAINGQR